MARFHGKIEYVVSVLLGLLLFSSTVSSSTGNTPVAPKPSALKIARLSQVPPIQRSYPMGLTTLIGEINTVTTANLDPQPVIISSFETPEIFKYPIIYANFADRKDWTLSPLERKNLKGYLERGGFLFIDAGINAEFLRKDSRHGQHHSFAEWDACPDLKKAMRELFPDKSFTPLKRSHELYTAFYNGLPNAESLPDTVRDFVVNEKWPDGTYSAVGLEVKGRIAVLATPIISMGWGKNSLGNWITTIKFRIREGAEGLSDRLKTAAYSGERFETVREDGRKDIIYCQQTALPAWVNEPAGKWRVFRYYFSSEISEYAHVFYTRLGVNIFIYALTH